MRALLGLVAIGAGALSCSPAPAASSAAPARAPTTKPQPSAPPGALAASASGSPASSAGDAPPGTSGSAATPTATPITTNEPPPLTAETLAALPSAAAIYMAARVGDISRTAARLPESRELVGALTSLLDGPQSTPEAILAKAGIDLRGSILVAVVPAPEKSARALIDALVRGASNAEVEAMRQRAPDATLVRVLVPLERESNAESAAALLGRALSGEAPLTPCSGGSGACGAFGSEAPLFLSKDGPVAVAAYANGRYLRLDVAVPLFAPSPTAGTLQALAAFHGARGGFQGQCSKFNASASASLCIDPSRAGDLGVTTGYSAVVRALTGGAVDAGATKRIAAAGRAEAQQSKALAEPSRRLASDGTLSLSADSAESPVTATWSLTKESRAGVEKAFPAERCFTGQAVVGELLPALRRAFGDPGRGFSDPRKAMEAVREAGYPAFYIAFAGTWPNLIDALLVTAGKDLRVPADTRVCARHEDGRLVVTAKL